MFDVTVSVSFLTAFFQGLLSFFSPCVLPLLPVYLGYLSGGAAEGAGRRRRLALNTFFFVAGISAAFFILGLGMSAAGEFFRGSRGTITRVGGLLIVLFGLHQVGLLRLPALESERRIRFDPERFVSGPAAALLLGFTFSFAWTPCVGPVLASVLLMAASSADSLRGFALIGAYTLGFVLPFMAVGLFADALLNIFRRHSGVVRYTVRIGGVLLIVIGVLMVSGAMDRISGSLAGDGAISAAASPSPAPSAEPGTAGADTDGAAGPSERPVVPAPDFTLTDQSGAEHTLSDYQGQVVFLNFWATWCSPCRMEMPDIQQLYEDTGENSGDVVVLGVAAPGYGNEGSAQEIAEFLDSGGYTYPTVMDTDGAVMAAYGITAYPTTFMIDVDGNVYGYVTGAVTREVMDDIIAQTIEGAQPDTE